MGHASRPSGSVFAGTGEPEKGIWECNEDILETVLDLVVNHFGHESRFGTGLGF